MFIKENANLCPLQSVLKELEGRKLLIFSVNSKLSALFSLLLVFPVSVSPLSVSLLVSFLASLSLVFFFLSFSVPVSVSFSSSSSVYAIFKI